MRAPCCWSPGAKREASPIIPCCAASFVRSATVGGVGVGCDAAISWSAACMAATASLYLMRASVRGSSMFSSASLVTTSIAAAIRTGFAGACPAGCCGTNAPRPCCIMVYYSGVYFGIRFISRRRASMSPPVLAKVSSPLGEEYSYVWVSSGRPSSKDCMNLTCCIG